VRGSKCVGQNAGFSHTLNTGESAWHSPGLLAIVAAALHILQSLIRCINWAYLGGLIRRAVANS